MVNAVKILQTNRVHIGPLRDEVIALDALIRSQIKSPNDTVVLNVPDGEVTLRGSVTQIVGANFVAIAQGDTVILTGTNHRALIQTCAAIRAIVDLSACAGR